MHGQSKYYYVYWQFYQVRLLIYLKRFRSFLNTHSTIHSAYFILMAYSFLKKVVRKSARDNLERYCEWFWSSLAMDVCLWVLKESNKCRFDSLSVRNSVLIISHITFRDCRVHIFATTFLEMAVKTKIAQIRFFCYGYSSLLQNLLLKP